jgi:tetratricopeptide (TPR) repeat protein
LTDDLTHYASKLVHSSVLEVLGELAEFQDAIFTSIEDRRFNSHNSRELYFAAAIVTGLVAHAMKDLGRMYEASTLTRTVYVCAEAVGHNALMAWAHGELSLISYRGREYEKALAFADSAISICGDARGSTAIWARALRARALAQMGIHGEALAAVAELERLRDAHVPDDLDEIGGLFDFSEPKQHYYVSGALVDVPGAFSTAAAEAQQALDHYSVSAGNYATEAGSRCELALARVRLGEFEGARAAIDPILDLPPSRRISGILESLDRIRFATVSLDVDCPAAQTMNEDIHQFCRFPAATLIA